ncbi:hypothetical protein MMC28_006149 [Mycoblastus sanguinarius]|nr:hypothetical protein [Mycoblastus sanguinarius]
MNVRTEIAYGMAQDGCTALSWRRDPSSSFLAQNWDWQEEQRENLITLCIRQENLPSISMITEAGIIGKIGLNSRGVGVCLNAIRASGVDFERLPCHLALRSCLESSSTGDAIATLHKAGVASACHILVADLDGGTGLECSHIDILDLPMDCRGIVTHTNHFIKPHPGVEDKMALLDSRPRLERIDELVHEKVDQLSGRTSLELSDVSGLLEDEKGFPTAISRSRTDDSSIATLFSIIMNLGEGSAKVVVGRPSQKKATFLSLAPRMDSIAS